VKSTKTKLIFGFDKIKVSSVVNKDQTVSILFHEAEYNKDGLPLAGKLIQTMILYPNTNKTSFYSN
jgi:hypothetical protein